ncbi:hypothetical protein DRH27_03735 [Candidatus Falkowbacteria bacterium]|nr:MAG: hypothetical protein DRH27_03735 [Candidatus Falkowbacteria bacterium]
MITEKERKPTFNDWLVMRLFNRPEETNEVCILTTRGRLLARHTRNDLKHGVYCTIKDVWRKVPGLRRYKTRKMAYAKAGKLNAFFNTGDYSAVQEMQL